MIDMITVNIANDFTRYPSGRYKKNGNTSGEAFRERFLEEPLSRGESILVEFDGTIGYGSSFLEEAFGGLVRKLSIPKATLNDNLQLKAADISIVSEVREYIDDAYMSLK
jgi:hypothetical protein